LKLARLHPSPWSGHPVYRLMQDYPPDGWIIAETNTDCDLTLCQTRPNCDGLGPWMVLIEDWVSLYHPEISNGCTGNEDVREHPRTAVLRERFTKPEFKGIICHHRGTFRDLVHLGLTDKLHYLPLGMPRRRAVNFTKAPSCVFTFINSYGQGSANFYNRGGDMVLRAFHELWQEGRRDLRLRFICALPDDLDPLLTKWAWQCPDVTVKMQHLDDAEFLTEVEIGDCLLLPSHRVHSHSILLAMSYGLPVITSDGWGHDEYVIDGVNGYRIPGSWGWMTGHKDVMREDYSQAIIVRDLMVAGLKSYMVQLADDRALLARLGRNAYDYVNDVHSVERMQRAMGQILG